MSSKGYWGVLRPGVRYRKEPVDGFESTGTYWDVLGGYWEHWDELELVLGWSEKSTGSTGIALKELWSTGMVLGEALNPVPKGTGDHWEILGRPGKHREVLGAYWEHWGGD